MNDKATYDVSIPELWQYINGTADDALKKEVELALIHQEEYWPLYDGLIQLKRDFETEDAVFEHLDQTKRSIAQQLGLDEISL